MINVLPIRGGSCQLCLRQGPLAGVVAMPGLLMLLKRQEVGVVAGRMKDGLGGRRVRTCSHSMQILQRVSGEAKGDRMLGFQFKAKYIYDIYRAPTGCKALQ